MRERERGINEVLMREIFLFPFLLVLPVCVIKRECERNVKVKG